MLASRTDAVAALVAPFGEAAVAAARTAVADALAHARHASPSGPSGRKAMQDAKGRLDRLAQDLRDPERGILPLAWHRVARDAWPHYREALGEFAHPEDSIPGELARKALAMVRINGVRPDAGLAAAIDRQQRLLHAHLIARPSPLRTAALDQWARGADRALAAAAHQILATGAYRVEAIVARLAAAPEHLEPDPTMETLL